MATNQDLQATHKILQFIESSKRQGDQILDSIPGIFSIINHDGEILRGNSVLASHLGKDIEDILYQKISHIFLEEEWKIFASHIESVIESKQSVDFELTLNTENHESLTYLWYLSLFETQNETLITVVGKDISDLKNAQQNLIEIFSSVPLGIITILPEGKIGGEVSKYSEILLGQTKLNGKNIQDVLFNKLQKLSHEQMDTFGTFIESIGQNELIYSVIKDGLPQRVQFNLNGEIFWLACTYQPVVYEGLTKKALLILQDITSLVKAEEIQSSSKFLEEASVKRIVQLRRNDEATRNMVITEMAELLNKSLADAEESKPQGVCNHLHGLKGCARVLGLEVLTELTHGTESSILAEIDNFKEFQLLQKLEPIAEEVQEIIKLNQAFSTSSTSDDSENTKRETPEEVHELFIKYRELLNLGESVRASFISHQILVTLKYIDQTPFSDAQDFLQHSLSKTADTLNKDIKLTFEDQGLYLDHHVFDTIKSAMIHIMTNAADHGIESPDERLNKGKSETGQVQISGIESPNGIEINITDDGAGFSLDKIRNSLIKKNLLTISEADKLSERNLLQWLFEEQFSSAEQVTEISGRGIGLASVKASVEALGGTIVAKTNPITQIGSVFSIQLPHKGLIQEDKSKVYFSQFTKSIECELSRLEIPFKLDIDEELLNSPTLKLFVNLEKIVFAISHLIFNTKFSDTIRVKVSRTELGLLSLSIENPLEELDAKQKFFNTTCIKYLKEHRGQLSTQNGTYIEFGHIIDQ